VKVILIPATVAGSGPEHFQYASSAIVNDTIAIDAGCLGLYRSPQDQSRIKHVLLTHSHIDHIGSLPIFVENAYEGKAEAVRIYGSAPVLDCCQRDLFNGRLWPDFVALSKQPNQPPFLHMIPFEPGQTMEIEGLRIRSVELNHVVPTVGYVVSDAAATVIFITDTSATDEIWKIANESPNLKAVLVETTFPNNMTWLADLSKHLTPAQLGDEVRKLKQPARIITVHIKPRFQKEVIAELQQMQLAGLEIAQFGVPYTF